MKRLREPAALCSTVYCSTLLFSSVLSRKYRQSRFNLFNFSFPICSYGDHVQHFKVLQDRSSQYYVWDELFSSLNELVEFYHCNSIAKERTVFLRDPEHFARVRT